MHRPLSLFLAAGLALTAAACMSPAAKQSSAAGAAGERAAKVRARGVESAAAGAKGEKPNPGSQSGAEGEEASWWQRLRRHDRAGPKPWHPGDVRPGKGVLSNDEEGYTLYRQGEAGSSDPDKPTKTRRR